MQKLEIAAVVLMSGGLALADAVVSSGFVCDPLALAVQVNGASRTDLVSFGGSADCSLAFMFRVEDFADESKGEWTEETPMTLLRIESDMSKGPVLFARIRQKRLFFTYFVSGSKDTLEFNTDAELTRGHWHHVVLTYTGNETTLYLDGKPMAYCWHAKEWDQFTKMQVGKDGGRRAFLGEIREPAFFPTKIEEAEVSRLYIDAVSETDRQAVSDYRQAQASAGKAAAAGYRALRVVDEGLHPLIDHLAPGVTMLPWHDAAGRDMLANGVGFGSRLAIYKYVGTENGLPVYDHGTTVEMFPRARYQSLPNADGTFDLFATGKGTIFGAKHFVQHLNTGVAGAPSFTVRRVLFDGQPMAHAIEGNITAWALTDLDGDGIEDFLYMRILSVSEKSVFPYEGGPWTGKEQRHAGPGKGYDIRGKWLGNELIGEACWSKGTRDAEGVRSFGVSRPVLTSRGDFPLLWKTIGACRALNVLQSDGESHLLMSGNIDELMAVDFKFQEGELICGSAKPVLREGYVLPHTYLVTRISLVDFDGDGKQEIVLDGNPGVVNVLKGSRVGEFESIGVAQTRGNYLAAETLVSPCRVDWNDNGKPDILTGDASGRLLFWAGTDDPWAYQPPVPMTVAGVPVKHEAGMSGSIQGSNEKRWGYLKVTAGKWGGHRAVITCDIKGELTLYRKADCDTALHAGVLFTFRGEPFKVAWRSRPDIVAASSGFMQIPHDSLLVQDWDGDLAVTIPAEPGGSDFREVVKLRYEDGGHIRLCGPVGLWGRGASSMFDWDNDGNLDILFGTNRSCHRFFSEEMSRQAATPFFIRNLGSNSSPFFERPKPITLASGEYLGFGVHNATPWVSDINSDGRADLLIGAEDGKVYYLLHDELKH